MLIQSDPVRYNKINITFPERVIVENIIPRNMIINLGCASVDNHIPRDDIIDYHPLRECNIYIIYLEVVLNALSTTCDFQQCGILTSVDSDEPLQSPFKLRSSKWCSVSSFTIIEYSSD